MRSRLIAAFALACLLGPQVGSTLVASHVALDHDEHGGPPHRDPRGDEVTTSDHDHALSAGQAEVAIAGPQRTQLAGPAVPGFTALLLPTPWVSAALTRELPGPDPPAPRSSPVLRV
jgi:hypothetical protein